MNPLYKVFSIIETVVAGQDKGVIYSEIVAALGFPKSSVHRILKDLIELGYLNFNPETKRDFGIKLFSEIGKTFPLHCTALGKALLASSPDDTVAKLLETPLKAMTEKTITDPDVFKRELVLIRDQGYTLDNEEITRGIMCVGAPVFGFNKELICAISIAFPAYINNDRGIDPEIKAIRKYAALISGSLGHR